MLVECSLRAGQVVRCGRGKGCGGQVVTERVRVKKWWRFGEAVSLETSSSEREKGGDSGARMRGPDKRR